MHKIATVIQFSENIYFLNYCHTYMSFSFYGEIILLFISVNFMRKFQDDGSIAVAGYEEFSGKNTIDDIFQTERERHPDVVVRLRIPFRIAHLIPQSQSRYCEENVSFIFRILEKQQKRHFCWANLIFFFFFNGCIHMLMFKFNIVREIATAGKGLLAYCAFEFCLSFFFCCIHRVILHFSLFIP